MTIDIVANPYVVVQTGKRTYKLGVFGAVLVNGLADVTLLDRYSFRDWVEANEEARKQNAMLAHIRKYGDGL